MAEIPEEILRRSAEAKAKATGRPVEDVLAELKGEKPAADDAADAAPAAAAEAAPEAAPAGDDSLLSRSRAAAAALPEHLLRRTAEARAEALGMPVDQVIAAMTGSPGGERPGDGDGASAAAGVQAPAAAYDPDAPIDWKAAGDQAGMPERLLRRSLEAKANATGRT
ncbi:MAG: hypothetical protein KQH83_09075, partial [Actinobacteria bacterium]|nr:hypothetical protein [Actinomycetota bacterium]